MDAKRSAFRVRGWLALAILAGGWLLTGVAPAHADALRCALAPAADDCARWLQGERQTEVALGSINGPDTFPTSAGPAIRSTFTDELQKHGITVAVRAKIGLRIQYALIEVPDARDRKHLRPTAELKYVFTDTRSTELDSITRRHPEPELIALLFGPTVDRTPSLADAKTGDRATLASIFEPKTAFAGAVVLAGPDSPFGIEVVCDGRPVQPVDRSGLAFVPLKREQEFGVRLVNRSDLEVAVRLHIDGLSLFQFSAEKVADGPHKGEPAYNLVLVKPHGTALVPGWHLSNKEFRAFKITEYGKSAAGLLRRDDARVGTITAAFAAAWTEKPPKDEPPLAKSPTEAVGFGRPIPGETRAVERTVGVERAEVSIRYELPK